MAVTIQFAPATTASDSGTDTRFWPGFSVGVCAATVVGALAATALLVTDRMPDPDLFDMQGTITLVDGSRAGSTPGFECEGDRGYDDISSTTAVRVSDENGILLANGSLTGSAGEDAFCTFFFTVPDAPRGAAFYDVAISHRGSVSYDEAEAESGVHLTLGH